MHGEKQTPRKKESMKKNGDLNHGNGLFLYEEDEMNCLLITGRPVDSSHQTVVVTVCFLLHACSFVPSSLNLSMYIIRDETIYR